MNRTLISYGLVFALLVAASAPRQIYAFGDNGHIAVAKVADKYLTTHARQKIQQLLGNKKIYSRNICMFADSYKHTPAGKFTRTWHFADIPFDKTEYKRSRDCAGNNCVVAQIPLQLAVLKDHSASADKKFFALRMLVHFVGDIHQPMHCSERNNDAGGNAVLVRYLDRQGITNLHSVWDGTILDENMGADDPEDYADRIQALITASQKADWEGVMDPVKWAEEGHKLADEFAYADIPDHSPTPYHIEDDYVDAAKPVIERQVQKAGVRLAKLLNEAFP